VLLAGAALRLAGIGFGLPYLYHWDEKGYYHGAFYVLATGGRTESLVAGNIPYILAPVLASVALANGLLPGSVERLVTQYLQDPTPFYLLGRIVWVSFQLLAVWLTYLIGRDALSRSAGLIAAAFLAAAFLVVSEGHYVKGDTTAMLGAVLTAWAALRLLSHPTPRSYAIVSAASGLAFACKAYTYPLLFVPLLAHLLAWPTWTLRLRQASALLYACGAALIAFALAFPAVIIDPVGTLEIWKVESAIKLSSLAPGNLPVWLTYWTDYLWEGLGWPVELLGLAGFVYWLTLWLRHRDAKRLLLLAFPLLLLIGIVSRTNHFARYALSIAPFVALAAGDLLEWAARAMSNRFRLGSWLPAAALAVVVALACMPSLLNDLRFAAYTSSPDTRTLAARWIETHLPASSRLVGEGSQGFEAMSTLGVPVRPDPLAAGVTWSPTSLRPPDQFWSDPLLAWLRTYTPTYTLTFAPTLTRGGKTTSTEQWGNPDAFIMLSWRSDPEKKTPSSPFWDDLKRSYELAAKFECSPCFPEDPYAWAVDYPTLARVDLFSRHTVAGPVVWIYARRDRIR
jgi:hypothetical protein